MRATTALLLVKRTTRLQTGTLYYTFPFEGEFGAVPGIRIGHQTTDNARLAAETSLAAFVHADLDILFPETDRRWSGSQAAVVAGALPTGVAAQEFRIVVAVGDELCQPPLPRATKQTSKVPLPNSSVFQVSVWLG